MPLLSIRNPLNKIRRYFSTLELTRGLIIALLASVFIYMEYWDLSYPVFTTLFGLLSLYLLLESNQRVWFWSGTMIGLFWFWWIVISFKHYEMLWAIPIAMFFISLIYGVLFWFIAKISLLRVRWVHPPKLTLQTKPMVGNPTLRELFIKSIGLLLFSYIHPFGFDWFKPELMFVNSYIGIEKWQFAIVLIAISLAIIKRNLLYLFLVILAYHPNSSSMANMPKNITLGNMQTPVEDKWDKTKHKKQFQKIFQDIDQAIVNKKTLIILPESVFPVFLNYEKELIAKLKARAKKISIVVGGLSWNKKTPYNSTYVFTHTKITIANKVLLVPFGESNPLPDFLSNWVNKVFYDGAVDYQADTEVTDYTIDGVSYRNAICFEATSEKLYAGKPKNMIVLSNNGWFTPSTEPTLQRLLLQYYSIKYGTTIYHSVNMSESYSIVNGNLRK